MHSANKQLSLEKFFSDWTDPDIGMYYVFCLLGFAEHDTNYQSFRDYKGIFASKDPFGDELYFFLENLVKIGMLEKNDDCQYRWNSGYSARWYTFDKS